MAEDANLSARPEVLPEERLRVMAAVCEVCGKRPSFGMRLSHSHRRTKRRWNPNIQRVRAVVNGSPKRLHVCTSCIRAGKVTKPTRRSGATPAA
jgi:large subunit ribosomal protein L28